MAAVSVINRLCLLVCETEISDLCLYKTDFPCCFR